MHENTQMLISEEKSMEGIKTVIPVQNVIDLKNQLTFKVLLANSWSPSPEMGGYTSTKREDVKKC